MDTLTIAIAGLAMTNRHMALLPTDQLNVSWMRENATGIVEIAASVDRVRPAHIRINDLVTL